MADRLLVLLLAVALAALVVAAVRWWAGRRTREIQREPVPAVWEMLGATPDGRTTVVAFSTRSCAACRTAQRPALGHLERSAPAPGIRVVHVDATGRPEVAKAFGIMTVPSTVVLDPDGRVAAVNHGFASADKLGRQVSRTPLL